MVQRQTTVKTFAKDVFINQELSFLSLIDTKMILYTNIL